MESVFFSYEKAASLLAKHLMESSGLRMVSWEHELGEGIRLDVVTVPTFNALKGAEWTPERIKRMQERDASKIEPGTKVWHRAGGPKMIARHGLPNGQIECAWFNEETASFETFGFLPQELEVVDDSKAVTEENDRYRPVVSLKPGTPFELNGSSYKVLESGLIRTKCEASVDGTIRIFDNETQVRPIP